MKNSTTPEENYASSPPLLFVILAGGSNLEHWPNSRINMPIQFQRKRNQASPFEQILAGVSQVHHTLPPIITLPSAALETGRQQLEASSLYTHAKIIVEPVDRGTLHAVVTSALIAAKIDRTAMMVILDASSPPTDWDAFARLVHQTRISPVAEDNIIFCGQPMAQKTSSMRSVEKTDATLDPLLFNFRPATSKTTNQTYELGAVSFATPRVILEKLRTLNPSILSSANLALQTAEKKQNTLWPDINIWSAQATKNFARSLAKDAQAVYLRPVDLHNSGTKSLPLSKLVFEQENVDCTIQSDGHLLAVAGCKNLHIIATPDATLIANKDNLKTIAPILAKLHAYERREIFDFPTQSQNWGQQREIDRQNGFTVLRLDIDPSSIVPPHLHNHRAENWHVLSGVGEAIIDNVPRSLMPGISLDLPRNTVHTCKNTGPTPLVIMETRFGSLITDTDHIAFEQHKPMGMEKRYEEMY